MSSIDLLSEVCGCTPTEFEPLDFFLTFFLFSSKMHKVGVCLFVFCPVLTDVMVFL